MKHLHKPIGQCLVTAIVTSAVLEAYALPLLGAQTPAVTPVQPTGLNHLPDASVAEEPAVAASAPSPNAPSIIVPTEAIAPIESGTPPQSVAPVVAPVEVAPAITVPLTAETATEPATPAAPAIAPTPTPPLTTSVNELDAARQHLADKLAEIVEQEKASREAEFQRNLVASALHYARTGEFDRARQVAQHPALPLEVQTATLAKITEIAAEPTLQPETTTVAKAKAKPTPAAGGVVATVPVVGSWGMPSGAQPIFHPGDRCLVTPPASAAIAPAAPTPTPAKATPANPLISLQAVSSAATGVFAALQQLDPPQAIPEQTSPTVVPDSAFPAMTLEPQQFPAMTVRLKQDTVQAPLTDSAPELTVDRMVGSTLKTSLQKLGLTLPLALPTSIASLVSQWGIALPELSAPVPAFADLGDRVSDPMPQPIWDRDPFVPLQPGLMQPGVTETAVTASRAALFTVEPNLSSIPKTSDKTVPSSATPAPAAATVPQTEAQLVQATATVDCGGMTWGSFDPGRIVHSTIANQMAQIGMRFPLAIPAALTSLFGWRIHPISGDRRFHAGIDLGAPMGTPVVAAVSGRVVAADYLGGYGLTVILENNTIAQRNLYAHLSGIAVQSGTWVEQGTVIGWVGSTGNSTGPHLHFEVQRATASGWVAVDPLAAAAVTLAQNP